MSVLPALGPALPKERGTMDEHEKPDPVCLRATKLRDRRKIQQLLKRQVGLEDGPARVWKRQISGGAVCNVDPGRAKMVRRV